MTDFLSELGFDGGLIEQYIDPEQTDNYSLDCCAELYREHLTLMQEEFDDWFILQIFNACHTVFMLSNFADMLQAVRAQFASDAWAALIQYEWSRNGESSVFGLMDSLQIGAFEKNLASVCRHICQTWAEDYPNEEP